MSNYLIMRNKKASRITDLLLLFSRIGYPYWNIDLSMDVVLFLSKTPINISIFDKVFVAIVFAENIREVIADDNEVDMV